jgi:hypothetical protein
MTEQKQSRVSKAIGIVIGTAVGGIIYGIFLQALLVQSLILDRRPLDPAEWRTKLSGKAWIAGLLSFLTLIFVPLSFLARSAGSTVLTNRTESGIAWSLIALILLIQLATVVYAKMRPELNVVEHPSQIFAYLYVRPCCRKRTPVLEWDGASSTSTNLPLLKLKLALGYWKNWITLLIPVIEFLQLMSMALDGGGALKAAGVNLVSTDFLAFASEIQNALWLFGMRLPVTDSGSLAVNFGLLTAFCGFYIFLCGVFIALDLNADSPLAPLLFTLLAGGFYGTITAGLLLLILYSPATTHVIIGLLMLAYYSSTAVFVSIYRSDLSKSAPGEVRIIPLFTALERVSKGVIAAISVAANNGSSLLRPLSVCIFCLLFLCLIIRMRPYSVLGVTMFRIASVTTAGWTGLLVSFAAGLGSQASGGALSGFLLSGWLGIPLGCLIATYLIKETR